jgi:hypothetical protein
MKNTRKTVDTYLPDLGRTLGKELLKPTTIYVNPAERRRWQELMVRDGTVENFEFQARRRDGAVVWLKDSARAVRDDTGRILHYQGAIEDITARKRAEKELLAYLIAYNLIRCLMAEAVAQVIQKHGRFNILPVLVCFERRSVWRHPKENGIVPGIDRLHLMKGSSRDPEA